VYYSGYYGHFSFDDVQQIYLRSYLSYKIFLMSLNLQKIFRLPVLDFAVEGSERGSGNFVLVPLTSAFCFRGFRGIAQLV